MAAVRSSSIWDRRIVRGALVDAVRKLNPRRMMRNPVMFVVEAGSVLTTIQLARDALVGSGPLGFELHITLWLWATVLFANFAEAMAEGRGKAQADTLRRAKTETTARRLRPDGTAEEVPAPSLRTGDVVIVEAGQFIPGDGEVVEGVASVDESAITGESAPVIRESGGDRSAVTGGTKVLSDWIRVRVTSNPGETFLDRMIALVEGAERRKTPNEIALNILLAGLTIVFLLAVVTLQPLAIYSGAPQSVFVLVALLVCLIPTTIGGLLSAIGIAGMDRLVQRNVLAMSGRAVEAAGDVHTLLLDKTGTITLGNRQATAFIPLPGVTERELADAAQLASLPDETPEGRSIVVLAKQRYGLRGRDVGSHMTFVPFSAQTRMSGVDINGRSVRKGASDAVCRFVVEHHGSIPPELDPLVAQVARSGGTPLVVADRHRPLGVIHLKDIVKGGIRERFAELRAMGIKTVMITGDNPLTAAAIAAEAGVDDYLAQATPEDKLRLIRSEQADGKLVAMTGDGTNDAPALAQADVAVAMNYRHPGRERGREHGGSRLQPHQAHRDRGDRQAVAHDARGAHDILHRERRGEVLRHHPGDVRRRVSRACRAQHHAAQHAAVGDPVGRHLQRAHHRGAGAAGVEGHPVPSHERRRAHAAQPGHLRSRRPRRAVRRHQGHRCDHHDAGAGLRGVKRGAGGRRRS